MKAVIDIGTNSALLLIGSKEGGGLRTVFQKVACPRVGRDVSATGTMAPEARAALTAALSDFLAETGKRGAVLTAAVATEAFRKAANGAEALEAVSRQLGLEARILSGEDEARLSYLAVRSLYHDAKLWVLDIGAGSTEVNAGSWCQSLPLGALGFLERFGSDFEAATAEASAVFARLPLPEPGAALIAVGGTASALALLEQGKTAFDADAVEGFASTPWAVKRWRQRLAAMSPAGRNALPGLDAGRAEILGPGLAIWEGFLSAMGFGSFRVSDRGLRYGLLWESWGGSDAA